MTPHSSRAALIAALLLVSPLTAEEAALRDRLREALYTEEVSRDPETAARQYQALLAQHDEQRPFAATALFRLAEVRRKQDRKDEAIALYQRLIREFPGATVEVKLAGQNLVAMGAALPALPEAGPAVQDDDSRELARLKALADSAPDLLIDPQTLANAARQGWLHSVDYLLEKGSEPYAGPALYVAAEAGYLDVCRRLINQGGKPPGTLMREVLSAAIAKSRIEVVRGLLDETPEVSGMNLLARSLAFPADKWNRALSELLVQKGAALDEMPAAAELYRQGRPDTALKGPPLHVAASYGNLEAARWLIGKGAKADVPIPDSGVTPLHLAIPTGQDAIVTLLLDAGADVNRAVGNANWGGAIRTNSLPLDIAIQVGNEDQIKMLVGRGARPSAAAFGQKFSTVKPELQPYLLRQFVYPEQAKKAVVTAVRSASNRFREVAKRKNDEMPSLVEILLAEFADEPNSQIESLVLLRAKPQGGFEETKIDLQTNDPLPQLAWGDILEIRAFNGGTVQGGFTSRQMQWQLLRRRSFPVRFEVAGKERDVTLSGDRFVFNPADPKVPVVNAGALVGYLYPLGREVAGGTFTLRVVRAGWPEIRIGYPSEEARNLELQAGDRLILDLPEDFQKAEAEARRNLITVLCPTLPFRTSFQLDSLEKGVPSPVAIPTLLQALAEAQARSLPKDYNEIQPEQLPEMLTRNGGWDLTVLPHPDYSRITIRRLKADGGEEVIPVDLTQVIEATQDDTPVEEARKADRELQPGDIVEVPVKEDRLGEPWKGMSKAEERLFAKALQVRVQWIGADGRIVLQPISFAAVRYVDTPAGWIPLAPPIGVPSLRGDWQSQSGALAVTRGGVAYPSQEGGASQVFLRDGDQLFAAGFGNVPRGARPRSPGVPVQRPSPR